MLGPILPCTKDPEKDPRTAKGAGPGDPPAAALPTAECTPQPNPAEAPKLSPEEQMALFEKDLKENDWGHQPC